MLRPARLVLAAALVACLGLPSGSLAGKKATKSAKGGAAGGLTGNGHGIGPGGVPALRDHLLSLIGALDTQVLLLEDRVADLEERLAALEALNSDDDGDGLSENQGDCNDGDPLVSPNLAEVVGNLVDDDCDGEIDEAVAPPPGP